MEITCSKVGARSISEFARVAARRWMDESRVDRLEILFEKLATFEQALDDLQAKVQRYRRVHLDEETGPDSSSAREPS